MFVFLINQKHRSKFTSLQPNCNSPLKPSSLITFFFTSESKCIPDQNNDTVCSYYHCIKQSLINDKILKTCECEYSVPTYIHHNYYINITYINKEMGNILLHHVNENH